MLKTWFWEYMSRLGAFGSAIGIVALFTGTLSRIEEFFSRHAAIGVIVLLIDVALFLIQRLADIEVDERERRLRSARDDKR